MTAYAEMKADRPASGDVLIRMQDVWKNFDGLEVLRGVTLAVERGETIVIIGESGCGKSVTLKLIIGILKPDRGRVVFDHLDMSGMSDTDLATVSRRFGMVFQGSALFDSLTVRENVAFGLQRHTNYSEEKANRIVTEKLRLVGLSGVEDKLPGELSGGMKKRVAIARATALDPEVMLYDEPTTGLDPIMADVVNELILRVQKNERTTSVVVTHDMKSAYKIGTHIAMLYHGRIIQVGTPAEIQNTANPVVAQFIHGEARERIEESLT